MSDAEYQELTSSEKSPLVHKRKTPFIVRFCFFILGAASNIAWNGVLLSVSYFQQFLGPTVLSRLGIAQNIPWLLVMIWLLACRSYMAWPILRLKVLTVSFVYMLSMCLTLLVLVVTNNSPSVEVLYIGIFFNGAATGTALALVASFAGYFDKYSLTGGALSLQIVGAGFGNLLPVIIQLIFIPVTSKASAQELPGLAEQITGLTFCIASIIIIIALWALFMIRNTPEFNHVMLEEEAERITGCDKHNNIKDATLSSHPVMVSERMTQIYQAAFMAFVLLAVVCWMTMVTPRIPTTKASKSAFWDQYLGTFLLSVGASFAFVGQIVATNCKISSPSFLYLLTITVTGFAFLLWFYVLQIPEWINIHDSANESVIGFFILMATLYGIGVVWLSDYAQHSSGFNNSAPCALAGQMMWLSIQAGCVFGISLSFIPIN